MKLFVATAMAFVMLATDPAHAFGEWTPSKYSKRDGRSISIREIGINDRSTLSVMCDYVLVSDFRGIGLGDKSTDPFFTLESEVTGAHRFLMRSANANHVIRFQSNKPVDSRWKLEESSAILTGSSERIQRFMDDIVASEGVVIRIPIRGDIAEYRFRWSNFDDDTVRRKFIDSCRQEGGQ